MNFIQHKKNSDNVTYVCVISGFCHCVNKTFDLMGCYAVLTDS